MSPAADGRRAARPLAAVALTALVACQSEFYTGCIDGDLCGLPLSREEVLDGVAGFADPMATFLREAANDDGSIDGRWAEILQGLGAATGCGDETERAFVVLSNDALRPKAILNRCVDDPVAASAFFMVVEPDAEGDDLDPENVRVTAWDPDAATYRRYQMVANPDGAGLRVSIEPEFCLSCHGAPYGLQTWAPIMNEMTNPWAQWNAEPGFSSFQFDEAFPEDARGPVFDEITGGGRLDSASNLEPIVRAAIDRTANASVAARSDAADLEVALSLLRPVFCEDSVNFVSEIHDAGELQTSALVDPGLRGAMLSLADDAGWPWAWVTAPTVRIPAPAEGAPALAMIAVRGERDVQAESALLSRQVLEADAVLRVRALDWTRPVYSDLRCGLYGRAEARAFAGSVDPTAYTDNTALVRALYDDAMQVEVEGELVPIMAATDGALVAVADALDPTAAAALATGNFAALTMTPAELGAAIDAWVVGFEAGDARPRLEAERHRRGCRARDDFVVTPLVPGLDDCA